jgi:endoglucanase
MFTSIRRWFQPPRPKLKPAGPPRARYRRRSAKLPWDSLLIGLSCIILVMRLVVQTAVPNTIASASNPAPNIVHPPLSTRGTEIIDQQGNPALLRGVNWFGLETENHTPHGLWTRDYKSMLAQMKELGYNTIRLPFSLQMLSDDANSINGLEFSIGSNRELQGKTPLEVMDAIIAEAGQQGLMVILDCHRLNNRRIPPLWYGDGFSEWDWIRSWAMLAERYKNQHNVIGADLKNEPHGKASWGTDDRKTDWRLAAERAGNAVLNVNPNWLIFVEGVEENVPGQKLKKHWMGGNLEGVRRWPVRLDRPNQVVYSPHEYGPEVYKHTWFDEPSFPENLASIWDTSFFYIVREKIAPIWIGEFGGRAVDRVSKSGIWQNRLVEFVKTQNLGFAYWSWNPNSGDTGGILQDDWQQVHPEKQAMLNQLLPNRFTESRPSNIALVNLKYPLKSQKSKDKTKSSPIARPSPSPIPSPSSSPESNLSLKPNASPNPTSGNAPLANQALTIQTKLQSEWDQGFCIEVKVTNPTSQAVKSWVLQFNMNDAAIDQKWNGRFRPSGNATYEVQPPSWGKSVGPNQTIELGFCARKTGPNPMPRNFTIVNRG